MRTLTQHTVGRVVNLAAPIMDTMLLPGAASDDESLAHSRALLERVSAHADAFVAEGLPPEVVAKLRIARRVGPPVSAASFR